MAKEIEYIFHYRKDGEKKELKVKIDFIPNKRITEFNEFIRHIGGIAKSWEQIGDLQVLNAALETDKPEGWKEQIQKNSDEIKSLSEEIVSCNTEEILKMRFELLKKILLNNGVSEEFLSYDFWDECVSPDEIMQFLTRAINKDIDQNNKKKV